MSRRTRKIIGAVVVVGAVAAGGAAYTASIDVQPSTIIAGYGSQTVSGATVTDTHYTLTSDAKHIDEVVLDFSPAITKTHDTVEIGFAGVGLTPTVATPCTVAADGLSADCGPGLNVLNDDSASGVLAVAVHHN